MGLFFRRKAPTQEETAQKAKQSAHDVGIVKKSAAKHGAAVKSAAEELREAINKNGVNVVIWAAFGGKHGH
jgi:rRNA-processing protein FCF1